MEDKLRAARRMVDIVQSSPELEKLMKQNPVEGMQKALKQTEEDEVKYTRDNDKILYRIGLCVLGILALATATAAIIFGLQEKTIPEVLVALGSASVGALVGLFAPSPVAKE